MDLIRTGLDMSVGRFKALLIACTLLSIIAMGIEFVSTVATFERGTEGLLGVKRERVMHNGQPAFVAREFQPWSLARESGLKVGDTFVPDHGYDTGRAFAPGESVGGTIVRDGASLRAELPTTPRPIERVDKLYFVLNAAACSLGILISLAIGFARPIAGPAARLHSRFSGSRRILAPAMLRRNGRWCSPA